MFELRPYQAEAKQAILAAWDEGYRKTLLVLPTGCGKTVVFSSVTENQVNKGHRVLIMAHRGELLDQAADKLKEASGLDSVLEKAESTSLGSFLPVTVGSVQSLAQEKRLARFPNNYFQDIIVDEAQFLTKAQVERLVDIVDGLNIPVICYGLRADFQGNLFEGSHWLLAWADTIEEIKTVCWCGKAATCNARFNEKGEMITQGDQVVLGANDSYIALCRKHFRRGMLKPDEE